jgi:general secretion pathway protein A
MYERFYGLKEKPFNNTPDPKFLLLTPSHREALAQLVYGVQEHKGFMVLTGEVGTGKTTLLRALMRRLDSTTAVSFLFNSTLSFDESLEYMLEDFGIGKAGETRVQRLISLNNFLIERRRAGQNTVVIFDEAQNLEAGSLEHIRLLSNFETTSDKLIQILLVGQPELKQKLQLPELRQLKQRIGLRCVITPLQPEDVKDYVRSRLRVAGARDLNLFADAALRRIGDFSGGIPRVINTICDHCLLIGYADQTRRIDRGIVERAIQYLEEGELPARARSPLAGLRTSITLRTAVAAGAAVGTVIVGLLALAAGWFHNLIVLTQSLADLGHSWWGR